MPSQPCVRVLQLPQRLLEFPAHGLRGAEPPRYDLDRLKRLVEEYLIKRVTVANVLEIFLLSHNAHAVRLKQGPQALAKMRSFGRERSTAVVVDRR